MLPDELPAVDVLILPREVSDGRGLYDDSMVTLAKEIRVAGVTADYQHDANARKWQTKIRPRRRAGEPGIRSTARASSPSRRL